MAFADEPVSYSDTIRIFSENRKNCAFIDDTEVTVYKGRCINGEVIYTIKGRYVKSHLSADAEYFIAFHPGLNLIPLDSNSQTVMIQIWKAGGIETTITLGELIKSMDSLERTTSHFNWGYVKNISDEEIEIQTVEGLVKVNISDGKILFF